MVLDFADGQVVVATIPQPEAEWGLSDAQLRALVSVVSVSVRLGAFMQNLRGVAQLWLQTRTTGDHGAGHAGRLELVRRAQGTRPVDRVHVGGNYFRSRAASSTREDPAKPRPPSSGLHVNIPH